MSLDLKDAIELYQSQYELVDSIWAYYNAVAISILGYTIGTQRSTQKLLEFRAMQCGFLVFSVGNLAAIVFAQTDLQTLANYVNKVGRDPDIMISVNPVNVELLIIFHVFVTFAVVVGIDYVYRSRRNK